MFWQISNCKIVTSISLVLPLHQIQSVISCNHSDYVYNHAEIKETSKDAATAEGDSVA